MQTNYSWNVVHFNINVRKMEPYNVLSHSSFRKDIKTMSVPRKPDFEDRLRRMAQYHFWSKCEWEILISEWPPAPASRNVVEKVDVYDQLRLNWDKFVEYVWRHRKGLVKEYEDLDR